MLKSIFRQIFPYFLFIFCFACSVQKSNQKQPKALINWEEYSSKSIYSKDSIKIENFQGKWYAFRRSSGKVDKLFENTKCPQPYIAEIRGSTIRRNPDSPFVSFSLKENKILIPYQKWTDTLIINLITHDSLILTRKGLYWGNKEYFYSRYNYKRSSKP